MNENSDPTRTASELRHRAEERLKSRATEAHAQKSADETRRLLHELQVHQIELELQNEELMESRVEVEEALRRYTDLYDFAPVGYFTMDRQGMIRQTNLAMAHLLEVERAGLVGRRFRDFVSVADRAAFDGFLAKVDSTGARRACELELVRGRHSPLTVQLETRFSAADQECRIAVSDITLLRTAERERARLALVAQKTGLAVLLTDAQGRIEWVNHAFTRMVGFELAEVVGRRPDDLLSGLDTDPAVLDQLRVGLKRASPLEVEILNYHKDGPPCWYLVKLDPVFDERGRLSNFIWLLTDITVRKENETLLEQSRQELIRSNKDLEQFASVASHDLQEPLRIVAGFVELLAERYKGRLDEKADKYMHFALDGTGRMKVLIDDLLRFARVNTQAKPFQRLDAQAALDQALRSLGRSITDKEAVVTHDPLPSIVGDTTQMTQLFQNLVGNAIKFCNRTPPHVHVGAERRGNTWQFSIRDNGIGIAPKDMDRIFILFQRLHAREAYPGTGMGLAICKKIVERHGGRIWVESQVGQGSTFVFTIPVERAHEP